MSTCVRAYKLAPRDLLVNLPQLVSAYYARKPNARISEQQVAFGSSGHRGSPFSSILQRRPHPGALPSDQPVAAETITRPFFLGMDMHVLPELARHRIPEAIWPQIEAVGSTSGTGRFASLAQGEQPWNIHILVVPACRSADCV
jgi:hypothetical protein